MTEFDPVDPELRAVLDNLPIMRISSEALPKIRAGIETNYGIEATRADLAVTIPGWEGGPPVPVHVYFPANMEEPCPALIDLHGGGFVLGSSAMTDAANRKLADTLGYVVISPDYRLAPETTFPGPLDDCYATLQWAHANAEELRIDAGRIAVSGTSAGGALAASLALLARDRGELEIAFLVLLSPVLDDRSCLREQTIPYSGKSFWNIGNSRFGWTAYLGGAPGGTDVSAYASPARANALEGLPPTFLNVGALDILIDECLDFAKALAYAGVPLELHVYPGAFHGFELGHTAQVARNAERDKLAAVRRALGR
jgi:acetyl esterase/lipase